MTGEWLVSEPQYVGCGVSLRHVIPLDDLKDHVTDVCCWCAPFCDSTDETVIVHNSADGREKFERGERKPT